MLSGGPLGAEKYAFSQFHFHWGSGNGWGSEHTLNGFSYSGEVHFVTYNSRYESQAKACENTDGLAVLGILIELGGKNAELEEIINTLDKIRYKGETVTGLKPVHLEKLLPEYLLPCTTLNF